MSNPLNLHSIPNQGCKKECNKEKRMIYTENDLCTETNSLLDNLPIRCVGEWGREKIFFLVQYFGIFSQGMKNKWPGKLNYIEICSGPGRCIDRKNGDEFDGTARSIILHEAFQYIRNALFFDNNDIVVQTLNERIQNVNISNARAYIGDYYQPESITKIIQDKITKNCLNLIFIDPTDCSVPVDMIKSLKDVVNNVDLVINVATGTDFNRNIKNAVLNKNEKLKEKYSKFLGSQEYFKDNEVLRNVDYGNDRKLREKFREYYQNSLRKLGFGYFDVKFVKNFYDIVFASGHEKGLDFWRKATKYKFDGQKGMF